MPAFLAPFVGFAIGVLFSWAASEELARASGSLGATRSLAIVVLFSFLVFGPMAGYFLAYATDWSFAYMLDGRHMPSAVLLLGTFVNVAAVPLGFVVGAGQVRQRKMMALLPLGALPLTLGVVLLGIFARKLALYGTYHQISRGSGSPIAGSPVGYAVLWFDLCVLVGMAWTTRELRLVSLSHRRG